jgi:cytosine/adenosine deaminase-related metal-dependent hydrolase
MQCEAHACWLMHRADPRAGERVTPGHVPGHHLAQPGGDAATMSVEDVVRIGTAGGARVLGLDGIGTLQVGQAADFAVYDLDDPRYMGLHDIGVGPVASGGRARLRALLVAGRVVAENDAIPGLDLAELRREAQALVQKMLNS